MQLKLKEARAGKSSLVLREQCMKQIVAEMELIKERKMLAELKKFVTTGMRFRPKRARIALTLPDFARLSAQEKFTVYSDPVTAVGFQWKLCAEKCQNGEGDGWLNLFLCAFPPTQYEGPFEFGVHFSFRLFNAVSSKLDVQKEAEESKKFTEAPHARRAGFWKFFELKSLLDPKNDFLQCDGSIQLEVDFTIESATLDHFFGDNGKKEHKELFGCEQQLGETKAHLLPGSNHSNTIHIRHLPSIHIWCARKLR